VLSVKKHRDQTGSRLSRQALDAQAHAQLYEPMSPRSYSLKELTKTEYGLLHWRASILPDVPLTCHISI
jgi:hypothetical protein